MIVFHGNAEDIYSAKVFAEALYKKTLMNIVMVEYPGYSIYKGESDADTILENTEIVYDFIKNLFHLSDKNIFIFGRSIGTSPAIYLSSRRKPNALCVVSSFTSIRAVANNLVGPLKYLLKERFNSKEYIKNVTCPILFVHGQSDPLIPYKETLLLKDQCKCPYEVNLPERMTHNDFDLEEDIIKRGYDTETNLPLNLLYRYPKKETNELGSLIFQMMFPNDEHKIQTPKFFSLTLTNEQASRSFLYCLKFPEKYVFSNNDLDNKLGFVSEALAANTTLTQLSLDSKHFMNEIK